MNPLWSDIDLDPEEYGEYYRSYVDRVQEGNILEILKNQMLTTYTLIMTLNPEQAGYRYAEGKWSVFEVIGHLIDTERVFAYRALRFSRNDSRELPGFDQDAYVRQANFESRGKQSLANEYSAVRNASVHLFEGFTEEMLMRGGIASKAPFTVRSIPFIIAGHERHHWSVLREQYGLEF